MRGDLRLLDPGESRRGGSFRVGWTAARSKRSVINILLACIAVALEVYYSICGGSCSYLKGDLVGIPLQYAGIGYMAFVVLLSLLKADRLLLVLLSAGVGIEVYLVGFQVWYHTYCPYCLAFGGVVFILFLLSLTRTGKWLSLISMTLAFILFSFFFEGSVTPSYAEELLPPAFGQGKVIVRLYTDYFCSPCRAMEPDVEPLLMDLVKRNRIKVTFVDTPFYRHSALYARYYLYAVGNRREIEYAFAVRNALIEAAKQDIGDPAGIEAHLADKGVKTTPLDVKPVFEMYEKALKEDGITSTPACVIESNGKKRKASGKADTIDALKSLR